MSVQDSLARELEALPDALSRSSLAEAARICASTIDDEPGARDLASLLKEFRAILAELRDLSRETPASNDPIQASQERGPAPIPLRRTS